MPVMIPKAKSSRLERSVGCAQGFQEVARSGTFFSHGVCSSLCRFDKSKLNASSELNVFFSIRLCVYARLVCVRVCMFFNLLNLFGQAIRVTSKHDESMKLHFSFFDSKLDLVATGAGAFDALDDEVITARPKKKTKD